MERPSIIKQIKDILHRNVPDATAILYGSEARGDARPDSDIDLLILVDKDQLTWKEEQAITYVAKSGNPSNPIRCSTTTS